MSCMFLSKAHIDAMITGLGQLGDDYTFFAECEYIHPATASDHVLTILGKAIWRLNAVAYVERYSHILSDEDKADVWSAVSDYTFQKVAYVMDYREDPAVKLDVTHEVTYTLIRCFMYQACDAEEWSGSAIHTACKSALAKLASEIIPYSVWGISEAVYAKKQVAA